MPNQTDLLYSIFGTLGIVLLTMLGMDEGWQVVAIVLLVPSLFALVVFGNMQVLYRFRSGKWAWQPPQEQTDRAVQKLMSETRVHRCSNCNELRSDHLFDQYGRIISPFGVDIICVRPGEDDLWDHNLNDDPPLPPAIEYV